MYIARCTYIISTDPRPHIEGEVDIVSVLQSATKDNIEGRYGAVRAIDGDLDTASIAIPSFGPAWILARLDKVTIGFSWLLDC